jgi:ABC-type uncharacterized transport system ATPase subunit
MLLYSNLVFILIYINHQALSASSRKETHKNTESKSNLYGLNKKESTVAQKCMGDRQNMEILSMLKI